MKTKFSCKAEVEPDALCGFWVGPGLGRGGQLWLARLCSHLTPIKSPRESRCLWEGWAGPAGGPVREVLLRRTRTWACSCPGGAPLSPGRGWAWACLSSLFIPDPARVGGSKARPFRGHRGLLAWHWHWHWHCQRVRTGLQPTCLGCLATSQPGCASQPLGPQCARMGSGLVMACYLGSCRAGALGFHRRLLEAWERPWCASDAQLRELDAHSPEGLSEAVICPRGVGKTQMPVVRWVPPPYPAAPPPLALSPLLGRTF